jgi:hypothetical protein
LKRLPVSRAIDEVEADYKQFRTKARDSPKTNKRLAVAEKQLSFGLRYESYNTSKAWIVTGSDVGARWRLHPITGQGNNGGSHGLGTQFYIGDSFDDTD